MQERCDMYVFAMVYDDGISEAVGIQASSKAEAAEKALLADIMDVRIHLRDWLIETGEQGPDFEITDAGIRDGIIGDYLAADLTYFITAHPVPDGDSTPGWYLEKVEVI
jgi:hypothetical protein